MSIINYTLMRTFANFHKKLDELLLLLDAQSVLILKLCCKSSSDQSLCVLIYYYYSGVKFNTKTKSIREERREQAPFSMAVENVELMHKCWPKHSLKGTAKLK